MKPMIGVVGPCAAGKTTLVSGLQRAGYEVRHIAQEHSYVADMWKRLTNPDLLVYLHVSYPLTISRRKVDWTEAEYLEQIHRLRHARQFADCTIDTDSLSPQQVLDQALQFIHESEKTG
jgi:deoxyadenosine/deoxycytidine kinase